MGLNNKSRMVSMKPQHKERNSHLPFYFMKTAIAVKDFPC